MRKRLLYFCSFVPVESLRRAGFDMISAYDLESDRFNGIKLSGNPCSFIKVCSGINFGEYDGVIFTNCCNSTQRLYDYVKFHYPVLFTYLLELPRTGEEKWNCNGLIMELCRNFHMYPMDFFRKEISSTDYTYGLNPGYIQKPDSNIGEEGAVKEKGKLVIITSSLHKEYAKELAGIFSDYTCLLDTCFSQERGDSFLLEDRKVSCPRMMDFYIYERERIKGAKGVIYISMQKCDQILFAYPAMKEICKKQKIKILLVEEEYGFKISERSYIRYEAFKECMELEKTVT